MAAALTSQNQPITRKERYLYRLGIIWGIITILWGVTVLTLHFCGYIDMNQWPPIMFR